MYHQEPGEYFWNWILRVLYLGDHNIRLEKQELICLGVFYLDIGFIILTRALEDETNLLIGYEPDRVSANTE